MKITRLKKGYVIRLSNSEMALLQQINNEGIMFYHEMHASDLTGLSSAEKRILTEIETMKRDWMVVTECKRFN